MLNFQKRNPFIPLFAYSLKIHTKFVLPSSPTMKMQLRGTISTACSRLSTIKNLPWKYKENLDRYNLRFNILECYLCMPESVSQNTCT